MLKALGSDCIILLLEQLLLALYLPEPNLPRADYCLRSVDCCWRQEASVSALGQVWAAKGVASVLVLASLAARSPYPWAHLFWRLAVQAQPP